MQRFWKWIWIHIDPLLALIVALVCSVLGVLGIVSTTILISTILGTLTVLAFTMIRERGARHAIITRVDKLTGIIQSPPPDLFFNHESDEGLIIREAENEVWLIQETGNLITETKRAEIIGLLQRGGHVKVVVTSPDELTARLMAFRNANLTYEALLTRSSSFHAQIADVVDRVKNNSERLEIRYIPYPISITSVVADPTNIVDSKRRAVIRNADFMQTYSQKLDFTIRADNSPLTFRHYFEQSRLMFLNSYKIVLLAGAPRSGKTTLLKRLLHRYKNNPHIYFVISEAIWNGDERSGFTVSTASNPEPIRFAERNPDGSYEVQEQIWDNIARELDGALKGKQVIVLDEIGPMQLKSRAFTSFIESAIESPFSTIFATLGVAADDSELLRRIRSHFRSTILELASDESDRQILFTLDEELEYSLRVSGRLNA